MPAQLKELNSNVVGISGKLDGLSDLLEQGVAGRNPANFVDVELGGDCENTGKKFDSLLLPDGSLTDFEIPAEHVLVVTGIELLGFGADPGVGVQTRIFRGVGFSVDLAARRESEANASGRIFHIYEFNPGVVVASGGEVCTNNNLNITTAGHLRGYLIRQ